MNRFVVSLVLILFSSFILGQASTRKATTIAQPESIQRGVVVEEVTKSSAAEKADLREGDTVLTWHRGDATGNIESPFDMSSLAIEQGPRGAVYLKGLRGPEEFTWILEPGSWGLKTRPCLPENLLSSYLEGRTLAQSGKWAEAAEKWRTAAGQIGDSSPSWVRVWLLSQTADGFAQGRQWKDADDTYQQVLKQAGDVLPVTRGLLLRAWANTYKQRSDWPSAEKYYQQSILENQKSEPESLIIASTLNDLGTISTSRGDLAKAEEYLRQALEIRQKLAPGSLDVAISLNNLGIVASHRGDLAKAEEYLRRALDIRKKMAPGGLEAASSLNSLGAVAGQRGDLAKAEEYFRQGLEIRQKLTPGSLDVATSVIDLGNVAYLRGDLAKAEEYYRQALDIEEKLAPGSLDVANSLDSLGAVAEQRGYLAKAEEYYHQGLDIRKKLAPRSLDVAASLNNLGNVARQRSDLTKAEGYFRQALDITRKFAPGSLDVGTILNNLGIVARKRGELAMAAEYYRQSLDIRQKLAAGSMDVAVTLINLANVASQRGELTKAEKHYLQALDIAKKLAPGSLDVGTIFNNIGSVAEQQGNLVKAEEYLRQGLDIRQKLAPGSLDVAWSLYNLGGVARRREDLVKAEEYYRQALNIRQKLAPQSEECSDSLAALAKILRRKEQAVEAAQLYQQALAVLEKQMTMFGGSEETRSGFRSNHADLYMAYIDLLVGQKQPEPAFYVLERSRAQGLLETLLAAQVDIRKGVDLRLVEKERSLRESLTSKFNHRIQLGNDKSTQAEMAAVDKEIQEILTLFQEVEGQIRQVSPGYAALTQPQPLTAKEVQEQLLDSDTLLLEYALGQERSYVFAVSRNSMAVFQLPKRTDIEGSARDLYRLLTDRTLRDATQVKAPAEYAEALATLSRMVLGPVASLLNKKRLLIVSDGALQYIPFAMLLTQEGSPASLVVEHEIVNLPSASALAVLRNEHSGRKPAPKAVAILADPVFDVHDDRLRLAPTKIRSNSDKPGPQESSEVSDVNKQSELERSAREVGFDRGGAFPRLPFSRREADAIYSMAHQGDALKALDFEASKSIAVSSQLRDYRIVHFATHGLLNSEHPELSGLVFSLVDRQGETQDGFLRLLDIYNLDLNADLVVLSACQTALGKQIADEGLVGLARGFMYAGAPRVMASLWKVDDQATFELMKRFYEGVLKNGQPPAQALRSAQVWMSQQKQWRAPYYWAGFVLQGEWK